MRVVSSEAALESHELSEEAFVRPDGAPPRDDTYGVHELKWVALPQQQVSDYNSRTAAIALAAVHENARLVTARRTTDGTRTRGCFRSRHS